MRREPGFLRELPQASDPVGRLLALHAADPDAFPVLLESAAGGERTGRYSLLLGAPGEALTLGRGGVEGPGTGPGFCDRLSDWWSRERGPAPPAGWPLAGGWFLYLGYELAAEIEPTLAIPQSPFELVALARRMRLALIHDHALGRTVIAGEEGAHADARRVEEAWRVASPYACGEGALAAGEVSEDAPEAYLSACRRALAHIAAGDVYQANLARAWRAGLADGATPADLYARLRRANPGDFAGIAALPGFAVVSSSPERLVRVRAGQADTRPIAGTRPRAAGRDAAAIADLTGSPKEQAEHVMLIDLERNDLGRLCEAGSVRVDEMMVVESFAHVHHIVSNVVGRLREDVRPGDVVRAMFPGGTITGCPKVRCMQIIGELERRGRGAYTGAMGYLALDGSLDLNILIRTITVEDGRIELRAGAGIVADSEPVAELAETRAKARGLLRALGVKS